MAVAGPKLNAVMITESVTAKCLLITKSLPSLELLLLWQPPFQNQRAQKQPILRRNSDVNAGKFRQVTRGAGNV